jgi:hypothetical protein
VNGQVAGSRSHSPALRRRSNLAVNLLMAVAGCLGRGSAGSGMLTIIRCGRKDDRRGAAPIMSLLPYARECSTTWTTGLWFWSLSLCAEFRTSSAEVANTTGLGRQERSDLTPISRLAGLAGRSGALRPDLPRPASLAA